MALGEKPTENGDIDMENGEKDSLNEDMDVDVEPSGSLGNSISESVISDYEIAAKKILLAGLPYGVVQPFLDAWEKENHFLEASSVSEIQPKVEGLLRAHKNLHKAVVKLCKDKKISLRDVQWPMASVAKTVSVTIPVLKDTRVWLTKNLGIPEAAPKVQSTSFNDIFISNRIVFRGRGWVIPRRKIIPSRRKVCVFRAYLSDD